MVTAIILSEAKETKENIKDKKTKNNFFITTSQLQLNCKNKIATQLQNVKEIFCYLSHMRKLFITYMRTEY